jgi:hypothetical protein
LITVVSTRLVGGNKVLKISELRVTCDANDEVERGAPKEEVVPLFLGEVEVIRDAREQELAQGPVGLIRTGNRFDESGDLVQ